MSTMITGEAKKSFKAIVVKELPEKGILNNLYFVLNGDEGDNKYDEYIWIKDPDTQQYMWEKVGYSYVDLTPYYTKTEIDGKLSPINNNLLRLNTETTFHPVININQIKPGGGQGDNHDRWTIDQAVLAAWEWINEDLTNRKDYLSPGISIMFRSTNLRDVNGFDGAWLIHNYSDVDFSQVAFTNPDKWCRVLTEADFKFEAADETYSGFLLNTDYIKFNNAVKSITAHSTNYNNPHQVTKEQVGLGNVDNTSDLDKPLSNNDKAALDLKIGSISIGYNIYGKTLLELYEAKEDTTIGGQQFSTSVIGTIEIPVVSKLYNGLFPASKYSILNDVPIIKGQVNTIEQKVMVDMGTSVITLDNQDPSALNAAITQGYSLIRISDGSTSKAVTIINEGDGTNFTQYKYEGGKQYVKHSLTGSWLPIGPITDVVIVGDYLTLYGRDRTGNKYVITSSQVPVLGSNAETVGLMGVYDYEKLKERSLILPENGITQARTYVELGSSGWVNSSGEQAQTIEISSATTSKAGVMTSDQVSMLDKSISSIVPTPSSDRITLKLKQNNGDTLDMPLGLVNTTNAGLMSPTDKSKLDGIESLASSDITALFS